MRYRREDGKGDYSFGQGDETFLTDSPETVAQAIKTRLNLWRGQWFLDIDAGIPYVQSVLGKSHPEIYHLAISEALSNTLGVKEILTFQSEQTNPRQVNFTATVATIYGDVLINSEDLNGP